MNFKRFLMLDIGGVSLSKKDRERLADPCCFGVILFERNYSSRDQLKALCAEIKSLRNPPLIIAVDHEGGRVQRFKNGFTPLPPMGALGEMWEQEKSLAMKMARTIGNIIGYELHSCGVDFSFTPVLDLDHGVSKVIGDRAFHAEASVVTKLASELIIGLDEVGCIAVGKHFPGHGNVVEDSHLEEVIDHRNLSDIMSDDLLTFTYLIQSNLLAGIMPAHITFSKIDSVPVGFSQIWLKNILREEINYKNLIFSDDLSMKGAMGDESIEIKVELALKAGCDVVLICNSPSDTDKVLTHFKKNGLASDFDSTSRTEFLKTVLSKSKNSIDDAQYEKSVDFFKKNYSPRF